MTRRAVVVQLAREDGEPTPFDAAASLLRWACAHPQAAAEWTEALARAEARFRSGEVESFAAALDEGGGAEIARRYPDALDALRRDCEWGIRLLGTLSTVSRAFEVAALLPAESSPHAPRDPKRAGLSRRRAPRTARIRA